MNRDIKFRAWDKNQQKYTYFSQESNQDYQHVWIKLEGGLSSVKFRNPKVENLILEQCIGLCDKHKMMIYEGDVLRVSFKESEKVHYWEVVWKDAAFKIRRTCNLTGEVFEKYINPTMVGKWEIIGSKHKVGKLLEL